jgi:Ca2+-dependent lipid-binding protein
MAAPPPPASVLAAAASASSGAHKSLIEDEPLAGESCASEDLYALTVRLISAENLMVSDRTQKFGECSRNAEAVSHSAYSHPCVQVADIFVRSSDPYAKITIDGNPSTLRTSQIKKRTLCPEFGESFNWILHERPQTLRIDMFDWDAVGKHDPLGSASLDLKPVVGGMTYMGNLKLEGKNIKHGTVQIRAECARLPHTVGRRSSELSGVREVSDIIHLVDLKVVGAFHLDNGSRKFLKMRPDPYCDISFGLHKFRTATISSCSEPVWNQSCPLWVTTSDHNSQALIRIAVYDHESLGESRHIGNAYLRPAELEVNHRYDVRLPLTKVSEQLPCTLAD